MTATYTLQAEEITVDLLQSIKEAFKGKTVDITVTESIDEEMDETEYLLRSPANRESLMRSMKEAEEGKTVTFSVEEFKEKYGTAVKKVSFTAEALHHLEEWKFSDAKMLQKIVSLVLEISSTPFTGTGKPEPLKFDLKGKWSRRINQEHRIVYEVKDDEIIIISCRYHY